MNRYRFLGRTAGIVACALILLLGALPTAAQDTSPTLKTAALLLWPEYDDPGLLVIFAGDFGDAAGFPRDISFPLPAGARDVQAAYPDASGGLLNADFEVNDGKLTYKQLPGPAFHFEYYVDRQPSGNQREITHLFQTPFAIETLAVTAQQPARATDFSMDPAAETSETRDDGLTYYQFNRANLAAGETLKTTLRYTKTDSAVSRPQLAVTNSSTTAATTAAPTAPPSTAGGGWLPWVLIGIGTTALAALLTYWILTRRQQSPPSTPVRKVSPPDRDQHVARPAAGDSAVFCAQCGHRHRPDDRFCAQCGAPRRG